MNRKYHLFILVIFALLACCGKSEKLEDKTFKGIREIKTINAEKKDISSYLDFSGKLESQQVVNLAPGIALQIEKIHVAVGDKVEKDQLLIEMDRSNLLQAESQMVNLKKNYERMLELKKTGSIDQQSFEEVETAYDIANSTYETVLENTEIRAPFPGYVTFIALKEGDTYNNMFEPVLIRILNLDDMRVKLQISDRDLLQIRKNQEALITVDNLDREFQGRILYIASEANPLSGTFEVEIKVEAANELLSHNQFARVKILTRTLHEAVVIPQRAVFEAGKVFVVEDSTAQLREVELGIENETEIQIIRGIEAGDEVVIRGNIGLKDGERVNIQQ